MIYLKNVKKFCKDDISLIENYDKAIADKTQVWQCHHRRETIYSRSGLKEIGEYYNRPACELIFLTPLEHIRLHHLGKHLSTETLKKISESKKGKLKSAEARKNMSESKKGSYFFNNGVKSIRAKECPGPEWQRGRIKKKNSGN